MDTEYQLNRAQGNFEQQIRLAEVRQEARANTLQELELEVAIRRDRLTEARENYRLSRELGADDRDSVYLTGEVGLQSRFALPFDAEASFADALYGNAEGILVASDDVSEISEL